MSLDLWIDEMAAWAESGPDTEMRFTLFMVPHVIRKEEPYVVIYQGLPPQRKKLHVGLIKGIFDENPKEDVVAWVARTGILGLMSDKGRPIFEDRLRKWWGKRPEPTVAEPTPLDSEPPLT